MSGEIGMVITIIGVSEKTCNWVIGGLAFGGDSVGPKTAYHARGHFTKERREDEEAHRVFFCKRERREKRRKANPLQKAQKHSTWYLVTS
jgi:hypothetical protein